MSPPKTPKCKKNEENEKTLLPIIGDSNNHLCHCCLHITRFKSCPSHCPLTGKNIMYMYDGSVGATLNRKLSYNNDDNYQDPFIYVRSCLQKNSANAHFNLEYERIFQIERWVRECGREASVDRDFIDGVNNAIKPVALDEEMDKDIDNEGKASVDIIMEDN